MQEVIIKKAHGGYIIESFNEDDKIFVKLADAFEYVKKFFSGDDDMKKCQTPEPPQK